jgi:hypothetical protein
MDDGVRIFFELRPLADIEPWGDPESGLRLAWFGLTDGWYDLAIDGHRLYSSRGETRGIGYQVVRLWEDLITVVPFALESVPEPLARRLADFDAWTSWVAKAWDLDDQDDVLSRALGWWSDRELSASHLDGAPTLQLWRCGDDLRLHWQSVSRESNMPAWSSPNGHATTNADAFREELIKFDRELINAMGARVSEIERSWSRPTIAIDVEGLRCEHADRSSWLQNALQGPRHRQANWDEVVEALIALENRIGKP